MLDCHLIKAEPKLIDLAVNKHSATIKLTGSNVSADTYLKDGSACTLQFYSVSHSHNFTTNSSQTRIKSISGRAIQLKLIKPGDWFKSDNELHTYNVICELKRRVDNVTETRQTRDISGGGVNDVEVYGGGVTIVNSAELSVTEVEAKPTKSPLTYDVRVTSC